MRWTVVTDRHYVTGARTVFCDVGGVDVRSVEQKDNNNNYYYTALAPRVHIHTSALWGPNDIHSLGVPDNTITMIE